MIAIKGVTILVNGAKPAIWMPGFIARVADLATENTDIKEMDLTGFALEKGISLQMQGDIDGRA
jgi:hypothetical protein